MTTLSTLNVRIRDFYDRSTGLWLETWGEHMHHGYYGPDGRANTNHRQAQLDLMTELLRWGGIGSAERVLDAGCGVGGSARFLARRFDAEVLGLTLSPEQARQAARLNREAGLGSKVQVDVQDVLQLPPEQHGFDLVWSLESAEHMPEKARLLDVFYRALRPGGQLLMATWCHRDVPPVLQPAERHLLEKIGRFYHLPPLIAVAEYERLARQAGFEAVKTADWTAAVAPFWPAVIRSALRWSSLRGLLAAGWPALRGAWAMRYMNRGYRTGTLRFGVLQARKL